MVFAMHFICFAAFHHLFRQIATFTGRYIEIRIYLITLDNEPVCYHDGINQVYAPRLAYGEVTRGCL